MIGVIERELKRIMPPIELPTSTALSIFAASKTAPTSFVCFWIEYQVFGLSEWSWLRWSTAMQWLVRANGKIW